MCALHAKKDPRGVSSPMQKEDYLNFDKVFTAALFSFRESLHLVNGKSELQRYSPSMMRGVKQ